MANAPLDIATTGVIDETVDLLREGTEKKFFDADDLIARLLVVRSRAERVAIVLHLAEVFVRVACEPGNDAGLALLGNDLMKACRAARGISSVRQHYEAMAREAQQVAA